MANPDDPGADPDDWSDTLTFTSSLGTRVVHARHFDRAMAAVLRGILAQGATHIRLSHDMSAKIAGRLEALALLIDSQALFEELAEEPDEAPPVTAGGASTDAPAPTGFVAALDLALDAVTLGCAVATAALLGWTALLPAPAARDPGPVVPR